jgi:hypothetical protein
MASSVAENDSHGFLCVATSTHDVPRVSKFLWKDFRYLATVDANILGVFETLICCAMSCAFKSTDSASNIHFNKERS